MSTRRIATDAMAHVAAIIERSFVPGTRSELTVRGEFLPLVQTPTAKRLFEIYVQAAAETGFTTAGEFTGGCADFRLHRRCRHADDLRGGAGGRQGAQSR